MATPISYSPESTFLFMTLSLVVWWWFLLFADLQPRSRSVCYSSWSRRWFLACLSVTPFSGSPSSILDWPFEFNLRRLFDTQIWFVSSSFESRDSLLRCCWSRRDYHWLLQCRNSLTWLYSFLDSGRTHLLSQAWLFDPTSTWTPLPCRWSLLGIPH